MIYDVQGRNSLKITMTASELLLLKKLLKLNVIFCELNIKTEEIPVNLVSGNHVPGDVQVNIFSV